MKHNDQPSESAATLKACGDSEKRRKAPLHRREFSKVQGAQGLKVTSAEEIQPI